MSQQVTTPTLILRSFAGLIDYNSTLEAMKDFNRQRQEDTPDELWVLEHAPVFTLGQAGLMSHLLTNPTHIPVIRSDRGGQITYHGPGQWVFYIMLDLKRHHLKVKELVFLMEEAVIRTLMQFNIVGERIAGAPGIYVKGAKIGALGLRIQNGMSRHGFALNVDMDLTPFSYINPCGYEQLRTTHIKEWVKDVNKEDVKKRVIEELTELLHIQVTEHER